MVFGDDLPTAKLDDLQAEYLSRLKKNLDKIKEAYNEEILLDKKSCENPPTSYQDKKRKQELRQLMKES